MSDREQEHKISYEFFQSFGRRLNMLFYGMPAIVLLAGMYLLDMGTEWWTPVLIVYAVMALTDVLGHGFQAVNMQMIAISDYWQKATKGQ